MQVASSFKSMQYENKSPVYTRDSHRVNTFARLESALRSVWLRSEAPSMEHYPSAKSLQMEAESELKSAYQSRGLMGFQKYVMDGGLRPRVAGSHCGCSSGNGHC